MSANGCKYLLIHVLPSGVHAVVSCDRQTFLHNILIFLKMLTTEKKNTATPPLENVGKRIGEIYQNDISKNFENQADLLEVLMGETELLHLAYTASIDFSLDERTHAAFHRHFHTIMHLQHEFSKTIIRA